MLMKPLNNPHFDWIMLRILVIKLDLFEISITRLLSSSSFLDDYCQKYTNHLFFSFLSVVTTANCYYNDNAKTTISINKFYLQIDSIENQI
ncbi:hypothetical protein DERP_002361 [Dermatophagoides pteronyssinus]|uniref:Uncharacterized protein n=1 Tax=Dermatophagoides pteronyssinus TaxID=6956 RepID=A0ABQ8JHL4_DERPT|nr:hypothetical protein DERP_002361 [Dermatophagoides pteronyssinus]